RRRRRTPTTPAPPRRKAAAGCQVLRDILRLPSRRCGARGKTSLPSSLAGIAGSQILRLEVLLWLRGESLNNCRRLMPGSLFSLSSERRATARLFFRTQFEDWRFTATSTWILQVVQPLLVAAPDLLLTVPRTCGGASEPTSHERRECATSFIFPLVQLAVDGLQLHLERLSLVFIVQKSGGSRVAFLTEGVARALWRGNSRAVTHEAGNDARR
ncbi:uncharacterized protein Tco025E_08157, partial [Trypanosoma conorhini]